jgi:hypothetical protein
MKGLEPPCLTALDPKSNASANFATSAADVSVQDIRESFEVSFLILVPEP